MGKAKGKRLGPYHVSDCYIRWAESLTGMLTTVKVEYGGVGQMLESPAWDEGKTDYAIRLTTALRDSVARIAKEMQDHVQGKRS
jgi:hypothetical protein